MNRSAKGPASGTRAAVVILTLAAAGSTALAALLTEDFSAMPTGTCVADGTALGVWLFVYNGYGCNEFVDVEGNTVLRQSPMVSTQPDETHASLVLGPAVNGDLSLALSSLTAQQLRVNGAPHPWEVGWVLWHFVDNAHFYYFIAKPNGWELGKADPAYPGAQRFLATGSFPTFPVGDWSRIAVVQSAATIEVSVNGQLLTRITDGERPYTSGRIGLYTEDADAYFDDVVLETRAPRGKGRKKG